VIPERDGFSTLVCCGDTIFIVSIPGATGTLKNVRPQFARATDTFGLLWGHDFHRVNSGGTGTLKNVRPQL
jgi:hypothetical protein